MNRPAIETLSYDLIGNVPSVRQSAVKGCATGAALFLVFEYAGFIIGEVPRIPVAWLMMVATIMVESVLFFRIIRLLREPRRSDFNFIIRLDYHDRLETAAFATAKAHRSFVTFTGAVLAVAALLELLLIRERSVMMLAVVPGAGMLFMVGAGVVSRLVIVHRRIPCSNHDTTGTRVFVGNGFFRRRLARYTVPLSSWLCGRAHGAVRLTLRRNLLYLMRGEVALSVLIIAGTPVLTTLLLLMIGAPASAFVTAIPLVAAFMMNYHFANELGEAAETLHGCHWYEIPARSFFLGNFYTLLLPTLSLPIIAMVFMAPTLPTVSGIFRLFNFLIAFAATVAVGCRGVRPGRSADTDPLVGLMLFAVIMVGNFIPLAGALFSAAAVGVMALLDGGKVGAR